MKENITFDDFEKLDIRIGEIKSAERVEGTDKLINCEVDFGEEKRQIVSGLAEYLEPEEIVGKKLPYVLNLEPRVIRGVESQGMLLAIAGENFSLLEPSNDGVPAGSKIS
ncbi:MAG: methionine--tRNA ligase subunit beta [Candidatus Campbellbacteria bacterium]|nr:methionine--tRNA ligase subunit beta [Candidatus Campbellbacteria bacterium]